MESSYSSNKHKTKYSSLLWLDDLSIEFIAKAKRYIPRKTNAMFSCIPRLRNKINCEIDGKKGDMNILRNNGDVLN